MYAKIDWSDIVRPLWLNFIKYEGVVVNYSLWFTEGKSKGKEMKGRTEKEKPRRSLRRRKEMIEIIDVGGSPESKVDPDKKEDKLENGARLMIIV